MQILRAILDKVSRNQENGLNEEWIEIKHSLDELDNLQLAEAAKSSL